MMTICNVFQSQRSANETILNMLRFFFQKTFTLFLSTQPTQSFNCVKPKVFVTPIVMLLNILKRNKCPSQSLFFNRGMQTELFHSIATIAYFIRLTLVSGLASLCSTFPPSSSLYANSQFCSCGEERRKEGSCTLGFYMVCCYYVFCRELCRIL